jgi:hypothetical protein
MENTETTRDSLNKELEAIGASHIMSPAYQRKKLIRWVIRNSISVVLYILFWKYEWVRWSLYVTVPLSLFSLFTILVMPYFLKKKLEKTRKKIDETMKMIDEVSEE